MLKYIARLGPAFRYAEILMPIIFNISQDYDHIESEIYGFNSVHIGPD